jgi:hypothetical protein
LEEILISVFILGREIGVKRVCHIYYNTCGWYTDGWEVQEENEG